MGRQKVEDRKCGGERAFIHMNRCKLWHCIWISLFGEERKIILSHPNIQNWFCSHSELWVKKALTRRAGIRETNEGGEEVERWSSVWFFAWKSITLPFYNDSIYKNYVIFCYEIQGRRNVFMFVEKRTIFSEERYKNNMCVVNKDE